MKHLALEQTFHLNKIFLEGDYIVYNVTFDGSEIRRSPVEVGSLSHYLQGFMHPR